MATKKFSQMSNKKLNALFATASDEDKVAIQEVLDARAQAAAADTQNDEDESQLTPEEQAAIDAAEQNGGINPNYVGGGQAGEKPKRMSDEERHALAEELKKNVGHKCQAVPFNTIEWVDGYIAGVVEEKRSNKVLYAIKTMDGRRFVKVHDSNLVRIFDETVEIVRASAGRKKSSTDERVEWTQEVIDAELSKIIGNVGKIVEFEKYRTVDEDGKERVELAQGRIIAIVPEKRTQRMLYRISIPVPTEESPLASKTIHKVSTNQSLVIAEDFDEIGAEMNAKYVERRERITVAAQVTPQDRVVKCEEELTKAEEKLRKLQEEIELKKQRLEEAKAELQQFLDAQTQPGEQFEDAAEDIANDDLA